jgi:DNA-binding protein Fis
MANPWFRLYSEFADDPKVQIMPEAMQRRLVMLMCSRCKGETLHETQRAFQWRISREELNETKRIFVEHGFIDDDWTLRNWDRRQYVSDVSTERVRKHRQAKKQHETNGTVTVTPPDTETDTDTEKNNHTLSATDGEKQEKVSKTSAVKKELQRQKREAVERLFAYYLAGTDRNPKMYELTKARMEKGLSRLEDCQRKCGGDLAKAEQLMGLAIDALVASEFHSGKNDRNQKYNDWIAHLFKSTEKLEWWLAR